MKTTRRIPCSLLILAGVSFMTSGCVGYVGTDVYYGPRHRPWFHDDPWMDGHGWYGGGRNSGGGEIYVSPPAIRLPSPPKLRLP